MLQTPEQKFPCGLWRGLRWSRPSPCGPWRITAEQISTLYPVDEPMLEQVGCSGKLQPMQKLKQALCRGDHAGAGFPSGTSVHGTPTEQSLKDYTL